MCTLEYGLSEGECERDYSEQQITHARAHLYVYTGQWDFDSVDKLSMLV